MQKRIYFWDNFKGILIFLVVFGHFIYSYSVNLPNSFAGDIYIFLYCFHMPAFAFASGFFSKSEHARSAQSLAKLFLYYAVFNTLMALWGYFYLDHKISFLSPYYSYWYLLSLITWRAAIKPLSKIKYIIPLSILFSLLVGYISEFDNTFSISRTVAFFPFFAAGFLLDNEKADAFLTRRKTWHTILYSIGVLLAGAAAFWAANHFGVTGSMVLMHAYQDHSEILQRMLIIGIAFTVIISMFLVIPNRRIPLLSKIGRNSLLIYLAHRFITIVYYRELFPYHSYSGWYLVFALIASVITCTLLSSDRLNGFVSQAFDKAALALCDPGSKLGKQILYTIIIVMCIMLFLAAAPTIAEFIGELAA